MLWILLVVPQESQLSQEAAEAFIDNIFFLLGFVFLPFK